MPHLRGPGPATAAALLAALACRENLHPPGGPVASVRVAPESLTIAAGDTATLAATARNAAGEALDGVSIAWVSSDTGVAAVGPGGLVHGVGAGSAIVAAVAERDTGSARVSVVARIAGIDVVPASATLVPGGSFPLAALALDPSGAPVGPKTATWSGTDTTVVRVSPEGAVGAGTRLDAAATPVGVVGGGRFATVSAGDAFTCGLTAAGAPFCWGNGAYGRLGEGTVDSVRVAPVAVAGGLVLRSLSAGRRHACGLTRDGLVL